MTKHSHSHSHSHSHGLYPKHSHSHSHNCCPKPCPPPCPPLCPPPCPPPCPPKDWCLPGSKGPKGDQGPRGYPGKDGVNCVTKCCRFNNAAELEKCKTTLTPDVTTQEGQADRAALEVMLNKLPNGCESGFILMSKCGKELANFCYVCDGLNVTPPPQYRSGAFTYGAINPYSLVINNTNKATTTARYVPAGYLSPGDETFLSRDLTYCTIPYKNGAMIKGFSWNWIGVAGMTVYFNLVALRCKPNGSQYLEVYGPKVQGENNTAVVQNSTQNPTYYAVSNNCGCEDLELKLNCGSTIGILIRSIRKTPAPQTPPTNLTLTNTQPTPQIDSLLVSNVVLENIEKITEVTNYTSLSQSTSPDGMDSANKTDGKWEISQIFPVIEKDDNQDENAVEYYTNVLLKNAAADQNSPDFDVYEGFISHTSQEIFTFVDPQNVKAGDPMKLADGAKLYVYDNTNYPVARASKTRKNARYIRNLFMSIEYCQLPDVHALPYQAASTGLPTDSPVQVVEDKESWPELLEKDIATVKETILKERADIASQLKFVYVPTDGNGNVSVVYTPAENDVVIYTHGTTGGSAKTDTKLAPTLF